MQSTSATIKEASYMSSEQIESEFRRLSLGDANPLDSEILCGMGFNNEGTHCLHFGKA